MECGGQNLLLGTRTYIMGILNITPDSFSDGGAFINIEKAVKHAKEMVAQGADIIDIGGESTRPGANAVEAEEEVARILPVIKKLLKAINVPISVDTYKSRVADTVLKAGVDMINDVWGLQRDPHMAGLVAKYKVPIVIMHNQYGTEYKKDIIEAIKDFFNESINIGLSGGIKKENIILDPGIGFGKDLEQNLQVMGRLGEFNNLGHPMLLGTSRKSMIGQALELPVEERLEGTLATSVMGIIQGVDILRVHDIKENVRVARLTDRIVRVKNG